MSRIVAVSIILNLAIVCVTRTYLKIAEEDNEAGELDEAEEVLGVVFPPDQDAALPLDPGEEGRSASVEGSG